MSKAKQEKQAHEAPVSVVEERMLSWLTFIDSTQPRFNVGHGATSGHDLLSSDEM